MAKDSVFNAGSVLRAIAGVDPTDYDVHVNIVGGGNIDGPSAGLAIFLALYSAILRKPLPQDVAVTGELSIQGKVRGIGGAIEKLYAARQAGMRAMVLPRENARDVDADLAGLDVLPVVDVEGALRALGMHKRSTGKTVHAQSVRKRRAASAR